LLCWVLDINKLSWSKFDELLFSVLFLFEFLSVKLAKLKLLCKADWIPVLIVSTKFLFPTLVFFRVWLNLASCGFILAVYASFLVFLRISKYFRLLLDVGL